jgi:hypothetical protein
MWSIYLQVMMPAFCDKIKLLKTVFVFSICLSYLEMKGFDGGYGEEDTEGRIQGEDTGGNMQKGGKSREDKAGMIQERGYRREDTGGKINVGGFMRKDTGGRIQKGEYRRENREGRIQKVRHRREALRHPFPCSSFLFSLSSSSLLCPLSVSSLCLLPPVPSHLYPPS